MSASSSIREILILHHSHTDIGFTHPPAMVWELHRRFIDQAIDLCEATAHLPEPSRVRWTCETTAPLLHWLEHASERQIARFRRLVKHGQLGAGAMYLNLTPLSNAETLLRGLEPIGFLRKELGLPLKVAINHDVNGVPWPLADMLLDADVKMLLMGINVHFGGFPKLRPRGFSWLTPSGKSLLAFNAEHYQAFDREARTHLNSVDAMAKGLESYLARLQKGGYAYDFAYLSATNAAFPDNNPPNPSTARLIQQWNAEGRTPAIRYILPEELAARLAGQPRAELLPRTGDWTDYWNFGSGCSAAETKVSRAARHRLSLAETVRALAPVAANQAPPRMWSDAWRQVLHYEEHTWCSSAALRKTPAEPANEQWYQKANTAYQASSLASVLFRDALEAWAGEAEFGAKPAGFLVCNPTSCEKSGWVRIPRALIDGPWEFFSSNVLQLEVNRHLNAPLEQGTANIFSAPAPTMLAGPFVVPPFGYRYLSRRDLVDATVPSGVRVGDGFIESPYYRLNYDAKTGRVLELFDKQRRLNVVDRASHWSFFGFVQETPDPVAHPPGHAEQGREAFFDTDWPRLHLGESCWNPDWTARRVGPDRLIELRPEVTEEGANLILRWSAPGVDDFVQKITLAANSAQVICTASFNKTDQRAAEGIYFTFPLAMENWSAHFDTAGVPVEFEREQLEGSCRDWITVDSWVAVHDARGAVTLACPDAPLVQVGDFRFSRGNKASDRGKPPLLLAWPMNNYWNTNFRASQPGYVQLRYVIASQASYDPVESTQVALDARAELEWQPMASPPKTRQGSLVKTTGRGVVLLGATKHKRNIVVRLLNVRSEETVATVRMPGRRIVGAGRVDATWRRLNAVAVSDGRAQVTLPARSVTTLSLKMDLSAATAVEGKNEAGQR